MTLAGLIDTVAADPALARAVQEIGAPSSISRRRTGSGRSRSRRSSRRVAPSSPSPRPSGRARTSSPRCSRLLPPEPVVDYPAWETLPHERLSPRADTVGRRLAVLRRLRHPSPTTRRPGRSASSSRRSAACCSRRLPDSGDLMPVALQAGDEVGLRRGRRARLSDIAYTRRRHGRAARRVRGARRHHRRLPADRGPPGPGRVLGRHASRRSATSRSPTSGRWRSRPLGLWAPPCRELLLTDEVRERARALRAGASRAGRDARQDRRRHPGRGHGGAHAGPARPARAARRRAARPARTSWCATPSGSVAARPTWSAPARSSSRRPGPPRPAVARRRSTSARRRTGRIAEVRGHAARARGPVVDGHAVRRRRGASTTP